MTAAAVLGRPVTHSLSPVLHRAAYAALGLDWTYTAIDCGASDLAAVIASRADWAGLSCTMPLKHAALQFADRATELAEAVGAANTLLPTESGWLADNTDVVGLSGALTEAGVRPVSATVLGAGGTAQAAVAALAGFGLTECRVLVRDPARTQALHRTADAVGVQLTVGALSVLDPGLETGLVVSTLPPGAGDAIASGPWHREQTVVDVVYAPWPTRLAAGAQAAGATVIGGAQMLLHQAGEQVRLMTGRPAPLSAMRAALTRALADRSAAERSGGQTVDDHGAG